MSRPQSIQIYLPSGDPRGMRVAEITTRIVRVVEIPRSQLADFLKLPESQQVGVYFLVGELSETGVPRAYIGQSGNVGARYYLENGNAGSQPYTPAPLQADCHEIHETTPRPSAL